MADKLIPERKQLLLDFISDPEIKQEQHGLSSGPDCFCIEGAFCEVYRRNNPDKGHWVLNPEKQNCRWFKTPKELPYIGEAPPEVWEWFGLEMGVSPKLKVKGEYLGLPTLNDTKGLTFEEFKKIIGEQL